jgi:predicted DNA-binding transcriptional regulator YafY
MYKTSGRLLALLGLLQSRMMWSGAELAARLEVSGRTVRNDIEPIDDDTCVLVTGADTVETVAVYIGMLGLDFTATEPPELVAHLKTLAKRYANAVEEP